MRRGWPWWVEGELHAGYGERLGYQPVDIAALALTPNNRAYQNHMIEAAVRGTLVEAVAALAPCPWLYTALGQHLHEQLGEIPEDHPYADWLRTYADEGFITYTNSLLECLQRFATPTMKPPVPVPPAPLPLARATSGCFGNKLGKSRHGRSK